MDNNQLHSARRAKNDEFYTQYADIQKEIEVYLEYDPNVFRGKVVYCNCDDPYESNFFRYFVLNFTKLGLKQLIITSYKPLPIANTQLELFGDNGVSEKQKGHPKVTANKFIVNQVHDIDDGGDFNLKDVAQQLKANKNNEWTPLKGNGDFRSAECVELMKQSDIVVTNPPFSLFREYVKQLVYYKKKFLIMGNMNAILYQGIFPLFMNNKLWLGVTITSGSREFQVPDSYPITATGGRVDEEGRKFLRVIVRWFTNLDHGRRPQKLTLMTMEENLKYSRHKEIKGKREYERYDNYDAIEVPFIDAIPSDYEGVMGVPITFIDKYNPEQFEILGKCENLDLYNLKTKFYTTEECKNAYFNKFKRTGTYDLNARGVVFRNGRLDAVYERVLIKHKKAGTGNGE